MAFLLLLATFYKDVLPILERRCQACHRPGEIAPMPLLTYLQARPWAAAMREAVTLRKMPPWFADPRYGHFANDPSLTSEEIAIFQAWANTGAPEGSKGEAPPQKTWPAPARDAVIGMPRPFPIPAKATIDYTYIILPTGFTSDKWIHAVEVRPSDRRVVHHAVLFVREPESKWLRDIAPGVMFAPKATDAEALRKTRETTADILAIYSPGTPVMTWPVGMAKKIPAGSDLVLQMHYTSLDTATQDQTQIGLVFARDKPRQRVITLQMGKDRLVIPPGDRDYRAMVSGVMPHDAVLLSFFPHMHLRGSAFEYQIVEREGRVETLLEVKPYDFYWQLSYRLRTPRMLRAGTRLLWTGHFDNSPNNPRNPDPTAEVNWGEQSWQEMMIGFFDVAVDADMDKERLFVRPVNRLLR
jgi:hypothetical protein